MNRIVLAVVLVVALVVALLLWRGSSSPQAPTAPPAEVSAPSASTSASEPLALPHVEPNERVSTAQATEPAPAEAEKPEPQARTPAPPAATPVEEFGRIFGRVVRPDGAPAALRKLHVLRFPKGPKHDVVANLQGEFDERLRAGKWYVSTQPSQEELKEFGAPADANVIEYASLRVVELPPNGEVEIVLGVPSANAIRVHGRIQADSERLREVMLQWTPFGDAAYSRSKWKRSSADGAYEIMLEEPGSYSVSIMGADSLQLERSVEVPDVREFENDFELGRSAIRGILHTADGEPINRASVELTLRGGRPPVFLLLRTNCKARTEADGRFTFQLVDPGRYVLTTHGGRSKRTGEVAAVVARDVVVKPGDGPIELDLVVGTGVVLRGRVVRDPDKPVANVRVFVFDEHGDPINAVVPAATNKDGGFTLPPLAAGPYTLMGARGREWTAPLVVDVRSNEPPKDIELMLRDAGVIELEGLNLGDAWIDVRDQDGNCLSAPVDFSQVSIEDAVTGPYWRSRWRYFVPEGKYEVRAVGHAGVVASARVRVLWGETQPLTLSR